MEAVIERSNVWSAYQKVVRNGGAPGADGLTVESLVRPAGRTHLEVEVLYSPGKGKS